MGQLLGIGYFSVSLHDQYRLNAGMSPTVPFSGTGIAWDIYVLGAYCFLAFLLSWMMLTGAISLHLQKHSHL